MLEKVIDAAKVKIRDTHGVTLARWIFCASLIILRASVRIRHLQTRTINPDIQLLQVSKNLQNVF